MKTFRQFLTEAEQINYDMANVTALRKRNIEAARDILQNNKEIIQDINNAGDLSQFDTEEQRDAVVAAYILQREQPEYASKIGIDLQNPKNFEQQVKDDIIDPTRHVASSTSKKNPTIKEVKGGSEEKEEPAAQQAAKEEPAKEDPEQASDEPEEPEQASDDQGDEDEGKDDTESEKEVSPVNKEDFPAPKQIAKEIEQLKQETQKKLEGITPEDANRGEKANVDNAINDLNKKLNSLIKTADKADRAYSVNPTPMSMRRGSTIAKKALNDARAEALKIVHKAQRKQMPNALERGAKRVAEVGQNIGRKAKQAAESRPAQILKQQAGRAAQQAGTAIKRGAEQAKAATERVMGNIAQNSTAKMISQQLGTKPAQQYIQHLKDGEKEKAEALRQEALKRAEKDKQENRYNKMDQRTQDKALRQASQGKGGSRAAAVAKRVTDKFRGSNRTGQEDQRRQA